MDSSLLIDVISRLAHVGAAITLLGGSVFMRLALMPAAAELPDAEHQALRERMMGRWRKVVGIGIGLLLISGLYNYLAIGYPNHKGTESYKLYNMLMGIKILLALAVFFLASALTGRSKAFDGIRRNSKQWLAILILLASVIVAIGGYLKVAVQPAAAERTVDNLSQLLPAE